MIPKRSSYIKTNIGETENMHSLKSLKQEEPTNMLDYSGTNSTLVSVELVKKISNKLNLIINEKNKKSSYDNEDEESCDVGLRDYDSCKRDVNTTDSLNFLEFPDDEEFIDINKYEHGIDLNHMSDVSGQEEKISSSMSDNSPMISSTSSCRSATNVEPESQDFYADDEFVSLSELEPNMKLLTRCRREEEERNSGCCCKNFSLDAGDKESFLNEDNESFLSME